MPKRKVATGLLNIKISNLIIFIALILLGCNVSPEVAEKCPDALYSKITEQEILAKMQPEFYDALSGSGKAAMKISQELAKWILPVKGKIHPFEKWQRMGAENGYANAQHAYAQTLWSKRGHGKKEFYSIRAKYWAKRAADQGILQGKELLESFEAEEREEKKTNSPSSSVGQ
jgi:hypothetical protein